jgi:signal transduction histidine kinase
MRRGEKVAVSSVGEDDEPEPVLVLLVDADEASRAARALALRRAGHEVLEAATGGEALALSAEVEPGAIVLRASSADPDLEPLIRRAAEAERPPSLILLSHASSSVTERLTRDADVVVADPIDSTALVGILDARLRAARREASLRDALDQERSARISAEAASRAKDEFFATLSHELRSPLGAILAWVTLLRTQTVEEDQMTRGLEAIERSTRQQARLIEDLLDVSRIISGKLHLDVGPLDLRGVVRAAIESVSAAAAGKRIRVDTDVDATLRPIVGDGGRLHQVLWNLLSNAVKFTPEEGQVRVRVRDLGGRIEMRVTDSGRGIEPTLLPHVFERFRQGGSELPRSESGLGIGLAIVRHIVELHGGSVEARSEGVGHGATFVVRLPSSSRREAAVQPSADATTAEPFTDLAGLRVLVLDDEPDTREALSAVLAGSGAQVTAVATVAEALAFLARDPVDVVLSDIAMPVEDGYHFIAELRGRPEEEGGHLPVIALTAHAGAAERIRILRSGFDEFLAKPIEAGRLAAVVARLARPRVS